MKPFQLERRGLFGISNALLILIVFFFLLPSAFQSARLSLNNKENDVKDWLPSDFAETRELTWFGKHFVGESFVLATWDGCTSEDQRLKLLEQKLLHESTGYQAARGDADQASMIPGATTEELARARQVGHERQLLDPGQDFFNWGGEQEKWLATPDGRWHYITPAGRLYRWDGAINGPMAAYRFLQRSFGRYELSGQLITAFGSVGDAELTNPFYNDPSLVCAPLFASVQTGDSVVAELSNEGGALWPVDLTDEARRPIVAKRRAVDRLTGTLFAPAVPDDFDWTATAFRNQLSAEKQAELPDQFDALVEIAVTEFVDEQLDGDRQQLLDGLTQTKADAWYYVFDRAGITTPARQTCLLVTLTDLAKDNLAYAIGRGLPGAPRGRLLVLAEESGLRAAPPPSMAPPPFNQIDPDVVGWNDPDYAPSVPALRMGGPPVDNVAIDEEGTVTLVRLVGYSVLLGIGLSFLCFRSLKITFMVFVVGGSAAMLSMAMIGWTGGRVDAVMMSMPSLVYVLGLSGAIHVINYYRDEVRLRGRRGAPTRALQHALLPCTLASATTAIGLISLFTSNLAPISNFGLYSAIGVIATLAILFSYLPAALQVFAPTVKFAVGQDRNQESRLSNWWAAVGSWITRHHWLVSGTCMVALVVLSLGILQIHTSVELLKLFDKQSRIISDYSWLEKHFGKLVPMELVVRVPPSLQRERGDESGQTVAPEAFTMLERAEAITRIRTAVQRTLGEPGRGIVGKAMSADTFLPELPSPRNGYSPQRALYNRELLASADELRDNDYLRIEQDGPYAGSELWRISLRVAGLSGVDYGQFIATLRNCVEPVVRAYDTRDLLVRMLKQNRNEPADASKQAPSVLVVGSSRPGKLSEVKLLAGDGVSIDARATYLAALGELLSGEPIERPRWIDPPLEKAQELVALEAWESELQKYDAVIWVGGDSFSPADFASARNFINGEEILVSSARPVIRSGDVPDVVRTDPTLAGTAALQVIYTGVVPVVYKAQRTLLGSLTDSIQLAFVMIAAVMVVLLNPGRFPATFFRPKNLLAGIGAGMVSMLPNIFPILVVFGVMGHYGIVVGIGTMMTASVAMGVAVDDTIHFLSWFRSYLDQGKSRVDAVIETYRRVGPAMTQTTIVGGLGLFVFALSTFVPTQRFGTLMLVLLATALVGDLVFLPALLVGPLGRCFKPRDSVDPPHDDSPANDWSDTFDDSVDGEPVDDRAEVDAQRDESKHAQAAHGSKAVGPTNLMPPSHRTDPAHRMKR